MSEIARIDPRGIGLDMFLARTSEEVERICEVQSESHEPADFFIIFNPDFSSRVLAVRACFLERGQELNWPGLLLLGSTFDLDWGFSSMEIVNGVGVMPAFALPQIDPRDLNYGNTAGYRFCEMGDSERPSTEHELASILRALN